MAVSRDTKTHRVKHVNNCVHFSFTIEADTWVSGHDFLTQIRIHHFEHCYISYIFVRLDSWMWYREIAVCHRMRNFVCH